MSILTRREYGHDWEQNEAREETQGAERHGHHGLRPQEIRGQGGGVQLIKIPAAFGHGIANNEL